MINNTCNICGGLQYGDVELIYGFWCKCPQQSKNLLIEKTTMEKFNELVQKLSKYKHLRTVDTWNLERSMYKRDYDTSVISMLDASGYIKKWLKGK